MPITDKDYQQLADVIRSAKPGFDAEHINGTADTYEIILNKFMAHHEWQRHVNFIDTILQTTQDNYNRQLFLMACNYIDEDGKLTR